MTMNINKPQFDIRERFPALILFILTEGFCGLKIYATKPTIPYVKLRLVLMLLALQQVSIFMLWLYLHKINNRNNILRNIFRR